MKKLTLTLAILTIISLTLGSYFISPFNFISNQEIILNFRLNRVLTAIIVGSMLAMASLATQLLFNNVFASADFLGVSSINSLLVLLCSYFGFNFNIFTSLALNLAISFAMLMALLYVNNKVKHNLSFILLAFFISMFIGGLISFILTFSSVNIVQDYIYYTFGSLKKSSYDTILFSLPVWALALWFFSKNQGRFAMLTYGDESAKNFGININFFKKQVLLVVAILVAVSVFMVGPIAFVGIVSAHIARLTFKNNSSAMFINASLIGSIILLASDTIGRSAFGYMEISAGIITLILASIYFIVSFLKHYKVYI